MSKIVLTTPEELSGIIEAAIVKCLTGTHENGFDSRGRMLTVNDAVKFLKSKGYPTSKGTIYSQTSTGKMPFRKYGNKLIFDKTELLEWAHNRVISQQSPSEISKTLRGIKK